MSRSKPLRCIASTRPLADEALDAVVVPVFRGGGVPAAALAALDPGLELERVAARLRPEDVGWSSWVTGGPGGADLLLVSIGAADGSEATAERLLEAAMVAGRVAERPRVASLLATARPSDPEAGTIAAEGWVLGAYRFERYRHEPRVELAEEVLFWDCDPSAVETGVILAEAAATVRDLENTPGADLPPSALAETCRELGSRYGFEVKVRGREELERGRFGGLLAVGAGSAHEPLLIELERGSSEGDHLALVGKGITFDSGGLSLKKTSQMKTMKGDMAGAAAIVGALVAAHRLGLPNRVHAYLASAENMLSATSMRVGDVIRHRNGLSTEVIDTDCEGRLVLADVLSYAAESRPSRLIDLATLSSITGVGPELWAVLGTDTPACEALLAAGAASGEPGWRLPLWQGYAPRVASDVADLRNLDPAGVTGFGAVYAGLYLQNFVGEAPWAHVDLGITNMLTEATAAWPAGGNAKGTRTLARFLRATATTSDPSGRAHQ